MKKKSLSLLTAKLVSIVMMLTGLYSCRIMGRQECVYGGPTMERYQTQDSVEQSETDMPVDSIKDDNNHQNK